MDKNPQEALFEWYIDFLVFSIGVMSAGKFLSFMFSLHNIHERFP